MPSISLRHWSLLKSGMHAGFTTFPSMSKIRNNGVAPFKEAGQIGIFSRKQLGEQVVVALHSLSFSLSLPLSLSL